MLARSVSHNKTVLILKRVCNFLHSVTHCLQLCHLKKCVFVYDTVQTNIHSVPRNTVYAMSPPGCFVPVVIAMMENWIICGRLNTWEEWGQLQSHGLKALSHTHTQSGDGCHDDPLVTAANQLFVFAAFGTGPLFFFHRSQHLYLSDSTERNSFYVWSTSF